MVRAPCFDKNGIKKGAWSEDEDKKLRAYIEKHGHANWRELPKLAGLSRCRKSCRLRWMNYLNPNVKRGNFTKEEDDVIISLHNNLGNKWSKMAALLPGRSDNEIKNHWHTYLKHRMQNNQTMLKNEQYCALETTNFSSNESGNLEPNDANPIGCLVKNLNSTTQQEVEVLLAVLSSSSTSDQSSPCSMDVSDAADVTQRVSDTSGNIWTETWSPDAGSFISSSDDMLMCSPLGLGDDQLIWQTSFQDYLMDDMFLW